MPIKKLDETRMCMKNKVAEKEFSILNHVDILKIIRDVRDLEIATGFSCKEITFTLSKLVSKGYVINEKRGDHDIWRITPLGEEHINSQRQFLISNKEQKNEITRLFEEFESTINLNYKALITQWQMKQENGLLVLNNHKDEEYDRNVLNQIFFLHNNVIENLARISRIIPVFQNYIRRLNYAAEKIRAKDFDYMATNEGSYHVVWFQLHENILKFWGKERVEF